MPQSEQTGHTWHKFALSHLFSETALGFYTSYKKQAQRPKGRDHSRPFLLPTTCKMPTATSDIYTRRFRYSTHSTNSLTTGPKVFSIVPNGENPRIRVSWHERF